MSNIVLATSSSCALDTCIIFSARRFGYDYHIHSRSVSINDGFNRSMFIITPVTKCLTHSSCSIPATHSLHVSYLPSTPVCAAQIYDIFTASTHPRTHRVDPGTHVTHAQSPHIPNICHLHITTYSLRYYLFVVHILPASDEFKKLVYLAVPYRSSKFNKTFLPYNNNGTFLRPSLHFSFYCTLKG